MKDTINTDIEFLELNLCLYSVAKFNFGKNAIPLNFMKF